MLFSQQQQQTITPQLQQRGGSGSPPPGPAGVAPPSSSTRPVSWQLAWSQTAPSMQWVDDNDMDIQLGERDSGACQVVRLLTRSNRSVRVMGSSWVVVGW